MLMKVEAAPDQKTGLVPRDWADAMNVQDACNLSGVVHSFSQVLPRIWQEVIKEGGGTDAVNRHPICVMYASQIVHLAGGGMIDPSVYAKAYDAVIDQIKTHGA